MTHPRTRDDLQAITRDSKFQTIPNRLVAADTRWYDMPGMLSRVGADIYSWELSHYMAQVFDAYGDEVEELQVSWSPTQPSSSGTQVFMQCRVLLNKCDVCLSWDPSTGSSGTEVVEVEGMSELTSSLQDKDGGRALEAFYGAAEDAAQPLISQIDLLNERFRCVRSAEQAYAIAAAVDPRVLATISEMQLSLKTDSPETSHPRSSPRM